MLTKMNFVIKLMFKKIMHIINYLTHLNGDQTHLRTGPDHRQSPGGGQRFGGEGKRPGKNAGETEGVPLALLDSLQSPEAHHCLVVASCALNNHTLYVTFLFPKGFICSLHYLQGSG